MNGKKAKSLRRIVNQVFLGKDENFHYRKYDKRTFTKVSVGKMPEYVEITAPITLIKECFRKQYKIMKRNYFEVNKYGRILNRV